MLNRLRQKPALLLFALILALGLAHLLVSHSTEPFFYNDETRHVMTGVYFRDLLHDMPLTHLREYTINYYLQYPALGLLVWPPFFYFVEGLFMSLFGTSLIVSKLLIGAFAAMACAYLFQLVRRTHDTPRAAVAVMIFGLAPIVFEHSHYVMLEMPTIALGLAATYHFLRYLDDGRRRDIFIAALASAFAALTRFDAIYLLPLFGILIIVRKRWSVTWRKEVVFAAVLALLIVLPFYAITASGIGWFHVKQATETLAPEFPGFLSLSRYTFYPAHLAGQLSFFALIPALIGLVIAVVTRQRAAYWPYLAMVVATYLTFTPLGEMDSRHSIYWVPAFALFAAEGLWLLGSLWHKSRLYVPLAALVIMGIGWTALARPIYFVRGYESAARYVVSNSTNSPVCLFIGGLNGDFVYQIRRQDPSRRLWVVRADKLFFSSLGSSQFEYQQFTTSEEEVLATIFKYDPEFIVAEESQVVHPANIDVQTRTDFERRLRDILKSHPERFELTQQVAVESNEPNYAGMRLLIFRNILRNDRPDRKLEIDIFMLRRSLQTVMP